MPFALASFFCLAQAYSPVYFTSEERSQFTEALDKFPRKTLPYIKHVGEIEWLDERRIILSARSTPDGWVAADNEYSKILVIDTDTLKIEDSGYRGNLRCYSAGNLLVEHPRDGAGRRPVHPDDVFLTGKWGEPLTVVLHEKGDYIAPWSCSWQPTITTVSSNIDIREFRLLPGHGVLKFPLSWSGRPEEQQQKTEWIASDGHLIGRWLARESGIPLGPNFYYLSWLDVYYEFSSLSRWSRITSPGGTFEIKRAPKLLSNWEVTQEGSGGGWPTRAGMLWLYGAKSAHWPKQGMYLETKEGLLRIDNGSPGRMHQPSKDGCRVLNNRAEGDTFWKDETKPYRFLTVFNLC